MQSDPLSMSDRLIAAGLAVVFVGGTLLAVPVLVLAVTRGRGVELLAFLGHPAIWLTIIVAAAGLHGFIQGPDQGTELLSHLWGTARPRRPLWTAGLWGGVFGVALLVNWLAG